MSQKCMSGNVQVTCFYQHVAQVHNHPVLYLVFVNFHVELGPRMAIHPHKGKMERNRNYKLCMLSVALVVR